MSKRSPSVTVALLDASMPPEVFGEYQAAVKSLLKQQMVVYDGIGLFALLLSHSPHLPLQSSIPLCEPTLEHLTVVDSLQPVAYSRESNGVFLMQGLLEQCMQAVQPKKPGKIVLFVSAEISPWQSQVDTEVDIVMAGGPIVTSTENGVRLISLANYLEETKWLTHKYVQQRAKCQCPFIVHEELVSIPVHVYSKTRHETPAVSFQKVCRNELLPDGRPAKIKRRCIYYRGDEEMSCENIIKACRYGRDLLPLSEETWRSFKLLTERELRLMATVNKSTISMRDCHGTTDLVVPEPGNFQANIALQAFAQALFETESVALARFCWRATAEPKLVLLKPHPSANRICHLSLIPLAFSEERHIDLFSFSNLPHSTEGQNRHMRNFLQATTLEELPNIGNPLAQRIYETVFLRASTRNKQILASDVQISKKIPSDISNLLSPDYFPFDELREEQGGADSVENLTEQVSKSFHRQGISMVNPINDFLVLVDIQGVSACTQLGRVIRTILEKTEISWWQEKAAQCVCVMREIIIMKQFDKSVLNNFLVSLLNDFKRHCTLWKFLADRAITLLVDDVFDEEDARKFSESVGNLATLELSNPPLTGRAHDIDISAILD